jgi:thioredoxin 1
VSATRPLVACLCAEWCGSCREYRPTFDALAKQFAEVADFTWIDVEDESDALGDPDIENFPTLLIAGADRALFFGPVTPQSQTAERLVLGALAGDLVPIDSQVDAADALAERVRRRGRHD